MVFNAIVMRFYCENKIVTEITNGIKEKELKGINNEIVKNNIANIYHAICFITFIHVRQ